MLKKAWKRTIFSKKSRVVKSFCFFKFALNNFAVIVISVRLPQACFKVGQAKTITSKGEW